jgi:hypothetical protein
MRMSKAAVLLLSSLALVLTRPVDGHGAETATAGGDSPEAVVKAYLGAMKSGDFATAFDQLTPQMTRNQSKEAWIGEQTLVMKLGEVQISSFEVFPARAEGADKAKVPNLLKSKDKFINQTGADEFELYTVVRGADGRWRIDLQELVETGNVSKWFPRDAAKE